MPEPDLNRLERAMGGLTIGVVLDERGYQERVQQDGLIEREEQLHIGINGRAEEFAVWDTVKVRFSTIFADATGQRDSPFDRPHFTYGARITTKDPVGVVAAVMDWITTDRNETVGATIAIGVLATDKSVKFKGMLHATFQGYGQPDISQPDDIST